MKNSWFFKAFTLVLALQFLNVQIQTAFATEAVTGSNPEIQQLLNQATEKLAHKLSGKSEEAIYRFAYRLYKKDIKGRNRLYSKTDEEFQNSLLEIESSQAQNISMRQDEASTAIAEPETAQDSGQIIAEADALEVLSVTPSTPRLSVNRHEARREKLIQNADSLLLQLGAVPSEDGRLQKASFEVFSKRLNEFRADQNKGVPTLQIGIFLKILLALLVLMAGLWCFVIFVALIAFGSTSPILYILAAGVLVGEIYAMKGIFSKKDSRIPSKFLFS